MHPLLVSIGSFHLYSLNVFVVLAWLVFSFLFWRALRSQGVDEEHIFNLTFYSTLSAFVVARVVFVVLNMDLFRENPLKIVALWVQPGMSLYGGLIGGLLVLVSLCRTYKVRVGYVLDAFGPAFGGAFLVGAVGAFLDGTYVGKLTNLPWATRFVGHLGKRHPVELYEIAAMIGILIFIAILSRRSIQKKWPYGLLGLWFFAVTSVVMFVLEFFKDTRVYFNSLRANQWILVALFAETIGAFYVRGGGREAIRPIFNKIYAKFSKRTT
ncbi:MAG: prolipoprotein diacylglyceryl transferase [Candidatus Gottesmanbacteria bacterium]|nr:prolipoprotein diacylglyceryl transferase [Candidatus Gottesmanbacteria bacterium]